LSYLAIQNVSKSFGGVVAVKDCSIILEPNKVYGLIGPNGSGKTTLFNLVTGFLRPDNGNIVYKGESLVGLRPREIAMKGVVRTFQLTRVFMKMTVTENLIVASSDPTTKAMKRCRELLEISELQDFADQSAKNLSFGQKKVLEFCRMLMMNSELIMLDEPMAGLTQTMIGKMLSYVKYAVSEGKTIFIIEHNLPMIMGSCEKIFVLDNGQKIAEGTPAEIQENPRVAKAYLGEL